MVISFMFLSLLLWGTVRGISTTSNCCAYRSSFTDDFTNCILQSENVLNLNYDESEKIMFVTHATRDIMPYASQSLMINSFYASSKNYSFLFSLESDASQVNMMGNDPRWNKVIITVNLIEKELLKTDGVRINYFVVMDVDSVVSDWKLDIANITAKFPTAHLLLSSDKFDVANTGVMIVRCSKWSLEIFRTWWAMRFDFRSDQQAFSALYSTLQGMKRSKKRTVILPSEAINTPYPIYTADIPSLTVLHLMGEPNELRYEVLKRAVDSVCDAISQGLPLPAQPLNITQQVLVGAVVKYRLYAMTTSISDCESFLWGYDRNSSSEVTLDDVMNLLQTAHAKTSSFCEMTAPSAIMERFFCGHKRQTYVPVAADYTNSTSRVLCHYVVGDQMLAGGGNDSSENEDGESAPVNITEQCISNLHASADIYDRYSRSFPEYRPPIMELIVKTLYDMFLLSDDSASSVLAGKQALGMLLKLTTQPLTLQFFTLPDLYYKASVIQRGLAAMSGRLGDTKGTFQFSQDAFVSIVETLQRTSVDHVSYLSFVRQYVKCSVLLMDCLAKIHRYDDALLLGREVSELAEEVFHDSSEETNQLGRLLLDLYFQRLSVHSFRSRDIYDDTSSASEIGGGDMDGEIKMIFQMITSLVGRSRLELSPTQLAIMASIHVFPPN